MFWIGMHTGEPERHLNRLKEQAPLSHLPRCLLACHEHHPLSAQQQADDGAVLVCHGDEELQRAEQQVDGLVAGRAGRET